MDRELILNVIFLINRYLHVLAAAVLIGGTLFYEMIVPVAIDELKDPQKLSVIARARWAFRWIVWCSAAFLLISGAVSTYRNWYAFTGFEAEVTQGLPPEHEAVTRNKEPFHLEGPGYWWLAHAVGGVLAILIALALVKGRTPPRYPMFWMRLNLAILLIVIFLASTTRHVRFRTWEIRYPSLTQRSTD
jgi:putative copper export protein